MIKTFIEVATQDPWALVVIFLMCMAITIPVGIALYAPLRAARQYRESYENKKDRMSQAAPDPE